MKPQSIKYVQFLLSILVFAINSIYVLLVFQISGVIWGELKYQSKELSNKIEKEQIANENLFDLKT